MLISDNLLILKDQKDLIKLKPENYTIRDDLFASPVIMKYLGEFHAWNKLIGKNFTYRTPKEEDVFSLGMVFMNTLLLNQYDLATFKRKILA